MNELCTKKCIPCEQGSEPLSADQVAPLMSKIENWSVNTENTRINRTFTFKGFGKTMAFVNAVAWIAQQEMHHPDMMVSYNRCTVTYTTHAANGLTENDFICAAKVDKLLEV